jgi:DNA invertase Pin-like site-specific DNA recombinase
MKRPTAYLRRSNTTKETDETGKAKRSGHLSYAMQEDAVRDLAAKNGDVLADDDMLVDWGISGRQDRTAQRKGYRTLRDRLADGQVSALYAYSLSRLARSTRELLDLAETCANANVPIRLAKEGTLDFASPHGRLYLTVLAAVATFESEVSGERGRDRAAAARANGEFVGRPPFGWRHDPDTSRLVRFEPEANVDEMVRQMYRKAPNARGLARTLNEMGLPSPAGGQWRDGTVRRIVTRGGEPVAIEHRDRTVRGSRALHVATFARLLVCAECGHRLTTSRKTVRNAAGESRRWTGYSCQGARLIKTHSRPAAISETAMLRWAKPEVARLEIPFSHVKLAETAATERAALLVRRERVVDMIENGPITRLEAEPRLTRIAAELGALDEQEATLALPEVDWSWPPETLAPVLASIFKKITVDLVGGVLVGEWRVPEWRR